MARDEGIYHQPVMVREVLEFLQPRSGAIIDATVGGGGHARAVLEALAAGGEPADAAGHDGGAEPEAGPRRRGRLLGIDTDPEAIASAQRQLGKYDNMELVHASYVDMAEIVRRAGATPVTGVFMDLGVSLHQLATPGRGFSFDNDGPIDMRFDQSECGATALDLIRRTPEKELRDLLRAYGEEPMSGRIARVLHERRREMATTGQLADAVRQAVPARFGRKALARVFQALRIATNAELENVRRGLAAAIDVLAPGGRLVVLAYHSLEDRIVKESMREGRDRGRLRVLTAKPVRPGDGEVVDNPRARSARLRAAEVTA
jgi:16S rRNA (cytosine1402-N4)-methyltransferase